MGIIKNQSISGTIYSYVGVLLGFVTTALLYPIIFSTEEVGLLRILVSYSMLFAQFAGLGITSITVKLFPYFRDYKNKHHGFLGIALLVSIVGLIISILFFFLLKSSILNGETGKADLFEKYFYYIIPLIIFTLLFNVFDTYYRVLYNILKGIIFKEVVQRILIILVLILFYLNYIDFHQTIILYTIALISPAILLFLSLAYNRQLHIVPDFNFIDKKLSREMTTVGIFGILAGFSGVLVVSIDTIMVERILGLSSAGIYSITFFFGTLILIPMRTMGKVGSVILAEAWKANDIYTINQIYKKSSISLSVIGVLLLIGVWGNINNVFHILTTDYLPGKYVILIIGIANIIDISLGLNAQIIVNSKYYRFLSYLLLFFAAILIISNMILIPLFGIIGAAFATLISRFIFNLIKFLFLYHKFRLQPFTYKILLLYLLGAFAYATSLLMPELSNYPIDIIVRSTLILILFSVPVYFFNISEDINHKVDAVLTTIFKRN